MCSVATLALLIVGGVAPLLLAAPILAGLSPELAVKAAIAIPASLATAFVAVKAIEISRSPAKTGVEAIANRDAVVVDAFRQAGERYFGTVRLGGEYWNAVSESPVTGGGVVTVSNVVGLVLVVDPDRQARGESS